MALREVSLIHLLSKSILLLFLTFVLVLISLKQFVFNSHLTLVFGHLSTNDPLAISKNYCATDKDAVYIGQMHHLAHGSQRFTTSYFPSGWMSAARKWSGLCAYTNTASGSNALCDTGTGSHAWKTASQSNPGFMCGRFEESKPFTAELGDGSNGVKSRIYTFAVVTSEVNSGKFSDIMADECRKKDMKPICDHPRWSCCAFCVLLF